MPAALNRDRSMFTADEIENLPPKEFVLNLRNADIVDRIYHTKQYGIFGDKKDLIVETDYNFYTLTKADQVIISELLSQAYSDPVIVLKDSHTHRIIGQIADENLTLY